MGPVSSQLPTKLGYYLQRTVCIFLTFIRMTVYHLGRYEHFIRELHVFPLSEVVRAMTYLINNGSIMYWGTARWGPVEIYECFTKGRELGLIGPICELGEYHWFHREKVEVYMAELYNKVGEFKSFTTITC